MIYARLSAVTPTVVSFATGLLCNCSQRSITPPKTDTQHSAISASAAGETIRHSWVFSSSALFREGGTAWTNSRTLMNGVCHCEWGRLGGKVFKGTKRVLGGRLSRAVWKILLRRLISADVHYSLARVKKIRGTIVSGEQTVGCNACKAIKPKCERKFWPDEIPLLPASLQVTSLLSPNNLRRYRTPIAGRALASMLDYR